MNHSGSLEQWLQNYIIDSLAPMEGTGVAWAWSESMACVNTNSSAKGSADKAAVMQNLEELDGRLTVARLARESREGGVKVAKRYLKILMELYPECGLDWYQERIQSGRCFGHAAVVHGWICAYLGYSCETTVLTYFYTSVNGLVQVALRGMSLGQTEAQQVLRSLLPIISEQVEYITANQSLPPHLFTSAVHQEIAAMRHESLYSRLFMS